MIIETWNVAISSNTDETQVKFEERSGASSSEKSPIRGPSTRIVKLVRSRRRDSTRSSTTGLQPKRQEGRQTILRIDWQTGWPTFANEPARTNVRVRNSKSLKDTFRADNYMAIPLRGSKSGARVWLISGLPGSQGGEESFARKWLPPSFVKLLCRVNTGDRHGGLLKRWLNDATFARLLSTYDIRAPT